LSQEGIEAEVVDPRTIVPLDKNAILNSVEKTGHLVVVDEANISCGIAAEISAIVAEHAFSSLRAPIIRVARPDSPVPFNAVLEAELTPTAEKVQDAVRRVLA
jgi:pyruvate dehydrogenase E1 component beta subunit